MSLAGDLASVIDSFVAFFRPRPRRPSELISALMVAISRLGARESRVRSKAVVECGKYLYRLQVMVTRESNYSDTILIHTACVSGLFSALVKSMHNLDFEARKSAVIVISSLLGRKVGNRCPVSDYICAGHREDFLFTLLAGYDIPEIALNCGMLLRECIRHESLAQILLESKQVLCLFSLVNVPNFDVASDAFATLRDLFTRHPLLTATYLIERYDELVFSLHALLTSDNYMTKRQSLKLVGEILLERNSCDVMNRYVSSPEHLKTIMRLLRDPSSSVQFEAFHVFKIFVANPNKERHVYEILLKNQTKLLEYLVVFLPGKDDDHFLAEKAFIRQQIINLDPNFVDCISVTSSALMEDHENVELSKGGDISESLSPPFLKNN